jgi:hypothetical protein
VERIGKLFLVLDAVSRRCLCCDGVFSQQEAPAHAQLPCSPAKNEPTEEQCELRSTHGSAH